jgi:DNA-binding FadR family transcriptional regulator
MNAAARIGPIEAKPTLTSDVAQHLARMIENGDLAPGDQLPAEHKLTSALNVSRTALREAVAALKAEGLLVSRRGAGVFVPAEGARRPFRIAAEDLSLVPNVLHVLELRAAVEIEAAGLAAERRTTGQAEVITAALNAIDAEMHKGLSGVQADFAFHVAIAEAANSPYFVVFLSYLRSLLIPRQCIRIEADPVMGSGAYLKMLQREHRAIEQAIWAGDSVAARDAMRVHLVDGARRYRRWAEEASATARQDEGGL